MMKWKTRTETTNIGVLELGNITIEEDYMEVCIDICDMSEELKKELKKAIEVEKIRFVEKRKCLLAEHETPVPKEREHLVWSDKAVVMDFQYLRVRLEAGKPIDYAIQFGFHDSVDENMEAWDGSITVDLSDYADELKVAIINVLVGKFS